MGLVTAISVVGPAGLVTGSGAAELAELSTFHAMAADDVHDQVFLSGGPGSTFLQVHDFDGAQVAVIDGQSGASGLILSGDSSTLYVALPTAHAVSVIDTATRSEIQR
ncbi:MAG: hypothetical protein L0Y54_08030 [Sporichthyaceae bacterium]|nr:hypothetical protein [Sporichthyaceae bacterium]